MRIFLVGLWIVIAVVVVPGVVSSVLTILDTMPAGPARRVAIETVLREAVPVLLFPLLFLAILGFGVGVRTASDVWTHGGSWFVPIWRSRRKKVSRQQGE